MAAFRLQNTAASPLIMFGKGLTITSIFIPMISVFVGMSITGAADKPALWRIALGGASAAFGVLTMHFLAMKAMTINLRWRPGIIALSSIVAWLTTSVALFTFFKLRQYWQTSWLKQVGCAMLLGGAITATHYLAMYAAFYQDGDVSVPSASSLTQSQVLNIGAGFSVVTGLLLAALAARRIHAFSYGGSQRGQQLTLACLLLNREGQVLVDIDGKLPNRPVTGEFDISLKSPLSPALLWLLKVSCAWGRLGRLAAAFRKNSRRIEKLLTTQDYSSPAQTEGSSTSGSTSTPSSFHRLALIHAVTTLSTMLGIRFQLMGALYDCLLETQDGWVALIVDQVSPHRADLLAGKGFRWSDVVHVLPRLAADLGVEPEHTQSVIDDIPSYVHNHFSPIPRGQHVGLMVVISSLRGLRIMVAERNRSSLPLIPISSDAFNELRKSRGDMSQLLKTYASQQAQAEAQGEQPAPAVEILNALGQLGVAHPSEEGSLSAKLTSFKSSRLPFSSLTSPSDILCLRRHAGFKFNDNVTPATSSSGLPRSPLSQSEGSHSDTDFDQNWIARIPFESYVYSSDSNSVDIILFTYLQHRLGIPFLPPPGFKMVELQTFEATHYFRCFPERHGRALARETDSDLVGFAHEHQVEGDTGTKGTGQGGDRMATESSANTNKVSSSKAIENPDMVVIHIQGENDQSGNPSSDRNPMCMALAAEDGGQAMQSEGSSYKIMVAPESHPRNTACGNAGDADDYGTDVSLSRSSSYVKDSIQTLHQEQQPQSNEEVAPGFSRTNKPSFISLPPRLNAPEFASDVQSSVRAPRHLSSRFTFPSLQGSADGSLSSLHSKPPSVASLSPFTWRYSSYFHTHSQEDDDDHRLRYQTDGLVTGGAYEDLVAGGVPGATDVWAAMRWLKIYLSSQSVGGGFSGRSGKLLHIQSEES
ncbi:uncharacterized protein SPPG_04562 [Spizellomyces punctatus DAOM BR117]|uniref:MHYT domain-containing protein n=1 Tax=Spizellomyces punctatus (strain DAOM BR117) TaxID=645134 RepID=A0A0L0HGP6_SPIPD|nr:uncharacterized protein SPPG_04562 [Spizellomyces punctatus DAOM BR117]KND00227.1 hypothetical protein SPPG_04562 [Spizellomyces punctatus DAOM BR117]|eukprot:XP_016608266.1 hypothetical protein SPPG_04562 [Spizellomyces punctatus DAOM BR117]